MPNRLINETSPYLLQHAHNPVEWYPWGDEALERARKEDKPILLSIGYSACHWCHVMAQECFENAAIAHLMIKIISPHSNFVKTLSLIAYCKLIYVVKDILYVVILRMKPLEDIESQADAQVSLSLSALFPDAGKYFSAFLENLGVFQIWYYILVIIGIATIFKMDRKKAVIPTLVLWVVILLGSFISIFFQGFGSRGMG